MSVALHSRVCVAIVPVSRCWAVSGRSGRDSNPWRRGEGGPAGGSEAADEAGGGGAASRLPGGHELRAPSGPRPRRRWRLLRLLLVRGGTRGPRRRPGASPQPPQGPRDRAVVRAEAGPEEQGDGPAAGEGPGRPLSAPRAAPHGHDPSGTAGRGAGDARGRRGTSAA